MADGKIEIGIELDDSKAKSQASKTGNDIAKGIDSGLKTASKSASTAANEIDKSFKSAGDSAKSSMSRVGDSAKSSFGDVGDAAKAASGDAASAFESIPADSAASFGDVGDAARSSFGDVSDAAKSSSSDAASAFESVPADASASFSDTAQAAESSFSEIVDSAEDSADGVKESFDGLGDSVQSSGSSAIDVFGSKIPISAAAAAAAIGVVVNKVYDFAKESIGVGMEFDKSMSQVAATMGTTKDDIGELTDFAKEMGATTAFSATQAAEALNYMALAGYDADTAMSMLPTVLNLAAAGNMELATASDMVTDAQSALGLSLEETSEMVDKMAMASSKSNTSVEQLGSAFLTVGGTAKTLQGGTTELATALGILADNGIKGAEGGTALRNIILALSAPTDQAAAKLKELGIEVFDAEGNMRSLNDIFLDLNDSLSTMTQGEQTQVLNEIFNKVDLKSANALLANTGERFDQLSGYIDDATGAAEQMAATQLDNLAGDITLLESAMEGFQISISDGAAPALRALASVAGQSLGDLKTAWDEAITSGDFTNAGMVISQAAADMVNAVLEQVPQFVSAAQSLIGGLVIGIVKALPNLIKTMVQTAAQMLPALIEGALNLVTALVAALPEIISSLIAAIPEIIVSIVNALVMSIPQLVLGFIQLFTAFVQALPQIIASIIESAPLIVNGIISGLQENAPAMKEAGNQFFQALPDALLQAGAALLTAIVELFATVINDVITWGQEMFANAQQAGSDFLNGVVEFISQLPGKIAQFISDILNNVATFVMTMGSKAMEAGRNFLQNIVNFIQELPGKILGFLNTVISNVASFVTSFVGKALEAGQQFFTNITTKMGEIPGKMLEIGGNIVRGIWDGISGAAGWLMQQISGFASNVIGGIADFFGIHSPSTIMRDLIGKNLAAGIVIGFEEYDPMAQIQTALESGMIGLRLATAQADSVFGNQYTTNNQTLNFNQPIESPDQIARTMRMQQRYGLAGSY